MFEFLKKPFPPQHQDHRPGLESEMQPLPIFKKDSSIGCEKLKNKVAIVTGGDSGIGRAVSVAFAQEGADIGIIYLNEHDDAKETQRHIMEEGRRCILISGDVGHESFCQSAVKEIFNEFGKINILVNCAGEIHLQPTIEKISEEQLEKTFRTNFFGTFFMSKATFKYLQEGDSIINTTSITAYRGSPQLLDYSATKGAVLCFTRSLSMGLLEKGVRVNAVAPGPIWTPFIPSSYPAMQVSTFGGDVPMKRAGQPVEVAPSYVFLASDDASYMTGQTLHPNGGEIVNG